MVTDSFYSNTPLALLEWVARGGSIVSITMLVTLFVGEGLHPSEVAPKEWIGLLFFPLGVMIGMAMAWWREGLGGVVAIASLGAFYLIYGFAMGSHVSGWAFVVFTLPGFLFLLHWLLARIWLTPSSLEHEVLKDHEDTYRI